MATLTLLSKDNMKIKVKVASATKSGVLKDLIENLGTNKKEVIPIQEVTGSVLKKCIEFCDSKRNHDKISAWHRRFFDVDRATLFEIIIAANYLDIPSLVDIGTTIIAEQIVGKEPLEVATYFGQEHRMEELNETLESLKLP